MDTLLHLKCSAHRLAYAPQVVLDGVEVDFINPDMKLPKAAEQEMRWCVFDASPLVYAVATAI